MTSTQTTFDFEAKRDQMHREAETLVAFLQEQGPVWTSARRIQSALGFSDRKVRALKGISGSRIISGPGCPGYRHIDHCTLDDIDSSSNRIISQARHMIRDAIAMRKQAHAHIH